MRDSLLKNIQKLEKKETALKAENARLRKHFQNFIDDVKAKSGPGRMEFSIIQAEQSLGVVK